jgi:dihydrofolate reductase
MIVAAIVATDLNNAIGLGNRLLWHLPADLKFFKATTMGAPVIMGRKTFESIGRLLPGRKNMIISRQPGFKIEGAEVYNTIDNALANCHAEKVFIIGGGEIYRQSMDRCQKIYRTLVKHKFDADTFFPEINSAHYALTWEECHSADEKNPYDYCFQEWTKKLL